MKKQKTKQTLKRALNAMPKSIRSLLTEQGLMERYKERPSYQQNDYLGWISRAKLESTRQKRIHQMLEELRQGGVYMKMRWNGPR